MADDFTRRRFEWLDQVLADRELSPTTFQVAYVIASHLNRTRNRAWPSQATLASRTGLRVEPDGSAHGIRKIVQRLVLRGHLEVQVSCGRGNANVYRPVAKTPDHRTGFGNEIPGRPAGDSPSKPLTAVPKTPDSRSEKPRTAIRANSLIENSLIKNSLIKNSLIKNSVVPPPALIEDSFDVFWNCYPKKVAKRAARRAFKNALKRVGAQEIIDAARRFAAEREGEAVRFTPHASTWLNADRWADEVPVHSSANGDGRRTGARSFATGVVEGLKLGEEFNVL